MRRFSSIHVAFAIALLGLLAVAGTVEAQGNQFRVAGSGRIRPVSTSPGVLLVEGTLQGRGAQGQFASNSFAVLIPDPEPSDECEPGEISAHIVDLQVSNTYDDFSQSLARGTGLECINLSTGASRTFYSGDVFSGTRRFEDARARSRLPAHLSRYPAGPLPASRVRARQRSTS